MMHKKSSFKIPLLIIALVACAMSKRINFDQITDSYDFQTYLTDFDKRYPDEAEFELRMRIFKENLDRIRIHNADESQTWKMGINKFTDMTKEEISKYFGYNKSAARYRAT